MTFRFKSLVMLCVTILALALFTPSANAQSDGGPRANYKGFFWGYCTFYAAQVFDKFAPDGGINWRGNGGQWLRAAQEKGWKTSTNPRDAQTGAVIVWRNNGRGHVAIVDDVMEDGILISEMNWRVSSFGVADGGFNRINQSFIPFSENLDRGHRCRYYFAGFIFPEKELPGATEAARPRVVDEKARTAEAAKASKR